MQQARGTARGTKDKTCVLTHLFIDWVRGQHGFCQTKGCNLSLVRASEKSILADNYTINVFIHLSTFYLETFSIGKM